MANVSRSERAEDGTAQWENCIRMQKVELTLEQVRQDYRIDVKLEGTINSGGQKAKLGWNSSQKLDAQELRGSMAEFSANELLLLL